MKRRNIKCVDIINDFPLFAFLNEHNSILVKDKHETKKNISLGAFPSHYTTNNIIELNSSRIPSIEDIEKTKSTYIDVDLSPIATSDWVKKMHY